MKRDDDAWIHDILHAAQEVRNSIHGITRAAFDRSSEKKGYVVYQITIIGEATSKLSKKFRDTHSSQPWSDIVGMRQIGIHHYWDYDTIWQTAHRDVPDLARYLRAIVGRRKP